MNWKKVLKNFIIGSFVIGGILITTIDPAKAIEANTALRYLLHDRNLIVDQTIKGSKTEKNEQLCLALNIYHEARGSTTKDKMAVGLVTLNRTKLDSYPATVCDVVFQHVVSNKTTQNKYGGAKIKKISQFSWVSKNIKDYYPREKDEWTEAQRFSAFLYTHKNNFIDFTKGATHFYAPVLMRKINGGPPSWAKKGINKQQIGSHVFLSLLSS